MSLLSKLHEYDTAEISDALDACGIEGALLGIKPVSNGLKLVGPAFTVKYMAFEEKPADFKNAGNYIDNVPQGAVIIVDNAGRHDCTTWGDILTTVAIKNGVAGTIVYGSARDIKFIREKKYPLYVNDISMRSGKNRVYMAAVQCELSINGVSIKPDDILFGDDNGVLVIPRDMLLEVIEKADNIKKTELNIINAFKKGIKLEEARMIHRYDQPWLAESIK